MLPAPRSLGTQTPRTPRTGCRAGDSAECKALLQSRGYAYKSEFGGFSYIRCDPAPSTRCHLYASETTAQGGAQSVMKRRLDKDPGYNPGYPVELAPYRDQDGKVQAYVDIGKLLQREAVDMSNLLLSRWLDPNLYVQFFVHQMDLVFGHWHRLGLLDAPVKVAATGGKEASVILDIIDQAFLEMAGKSALSETTLQEWRNALGGRNQQSLLQLSYRYVVPSVQRLRELTARESLFEFEGWSDSGEVDACIAQPHEFLQFVAETIEAQPTTTFAKPNLRRVSISIQWADSLSDRALDVAAASTCPPLPELLSTWSHADVYARVRLLIGQRVPALASSDAWSRLVLTFELWIQWPLGAYPCCEGKPTLRVRLEFAEDSPVAAVLGSEMLTHPSFNARCSLSLDGRRWRHLDLPDSAHGGDGGRTMWGMRCDGMLKHIARSPHSSTSWIEGLGGDGFEEWDSRTWAMWRITYFDRHMRFGSGAEHECNGWPVHFDPVHLIALDASLVPQLVRRSDLVAVPLPSHFNNNGKFSIGCGRYAPNCEYALNFAFVHPTQSHQGRAARATFFCDEHGAGVGLRDFDGGSGWFPKSLKVTLDPTAVAVGGHRCDFRAVLAPPEAGAPRSAGRAISHVNMLSSKGFRAFTVNNISARTTFQTKPPLPLCPGWASGLVCYYPLRTLRGAIAPRAVSLDYMLHTLMGVGAIANGNEYVPSGEPSPEICPRIARDLPEICPHRAAHCHFLHASSATHRAPPHRAAPYVCTPFPGRR